VFDFTTQYTEIYGDPLEVAQGEEVVFDFNDQEAEVLGRMIVKERFLPLRRDAKSFAFIDAVGLYDQLFGEEAAFADMTGEGDVPVRWAEIREATRSKLSQGEFFYEDAVPFLYLKELVEGLRTNTVVRHLFIDEGQDYSPFQFLFLKQLFPRARMTVLGDFGQAIFPQATDLHGTDSPLAGLYGEDETNLIRLVRSYRSTREIVEIHPGDAAGRRGIVPFDRHGEKPALKRIGPAEEKAASIVADLAALKAEGFDSIAVITRTAADSREAYEAMAAQGAEDLRVVTKTTLVFEKGTMIIPAYLAKGVEFDAVLIYDASSEGYQGEGERKLFYTACTRAMHRLHLYSTGEPNEYVRALDRELYVERV